MPQYEAAWLRRAEIFQLFAAHGLQENAAREWFSRAILDRGIVWDGSARPEVNLFRLARTMPARGAQYWRSRGWTPDPETIDWDTLEIEAPDPVRVIRTRAVIEASAAILRQMLGQGVTPAPTSRRGPKPIKIDDVADKMQRDIENKSLTSSELLHLRQKEIAARYGVSRNTAVAARQKALSPK